MVAFLTSLAIFVYFCLAGFGFLTALSGKRHLLRNLLLSPSVGISLSLVFCFWLSRLGLPVGRFALLLVTTLAVVSALLWTRFGRRFPLRKSLPFLGVFVAGLLLTGRPMLESGFEWLSYCNDDMANYVLGANRFLQHGYFDPPDFKELAEGRDASEYYWLLHVASEVRAGPDLLLALAAAAAGLDGYRIFMPLILALQLCLISSTAALVLWKPTMRRAALFSCIAMSLSAVMTLGVLQQLIAQVLGLALLSGAACLTLETSAPPARGRRLGRSVLLALQLAALLIGYPEVAPFLVLAAFIYFAVQIAQRRISLRGVAVQCAPALLFCGLILNVSMPSIVHFFLLQTRGLSPESDPSNTLFPYYLIPTGFTHFWGLLPIPAFSSGPFPVAILITAGALLFVAALLAGCWAVRKGHPVAAIASSMLLMTVVLFFRRADFGIFKIVMFVQPYLAGTLVLAWLRLLDHRWVGTALSVWGRGPRLLMIMVIPACLGGLNLHSQFYYVKASRGSADADTGSFALVPYASGTKILNEFQAIATLHPKSTFIADFMNPVQAKLLALYLEDRSVVHPCCDFFRFGLPEGVLSPAQTETAALRRRVWVRQRFDLMEHATGGPYHEFHFNSLAGRDPPGSAYLIASTERQSILNRRHSPVPAKSNVVVRPYSSVNNHLVYVVSDRAGASLVTKRDIIGLFPLEPDFFFRFRSMAALGRHLLFEVINPTPEARLSFEFTASLSPGRSGRLPPVVVVGDRRYSLPLVGGGSARVFSESLRPQTIGNNHYLAIDLGAEPQQFPSFFRGLSAAFGTDIPVDYRRVLGFARDISVISQEQFRTMSPPSALKQLPADLADPDLEYSGIYEDGWISEAVMVRLSQPDGLRRLTVRGMVPQILDASFQTRVRLLVDGEVAAEHRVTPGDFELIAEVAPSAQTHRIQVEFERSQKLPAPDSRLVAAKLGYIGFGAHESSDPNSSGPR